MAKVKPFSPHDCRRSYITALLAAGNSIAVVQKLRQGTHQLHNRPLRSVRRRRETKSS
jgi:hypothetical protein